MELGLGVGFFGVRLPELSNSSPIALLPRGRYSLFHQPRLVFKRSLSVSVSRSSLPEGGLYGEDVMRIFLKDRQLNGDFISKVSDMLWLWRKENSEFSEVEANTLQEDNPNNGQVMDTNSDSGFLKLTSARDWISGRNSAPVNKKAVAKNWQNESETRKKLNLLKYEVLKRELLFLTIGIGVACSGYCLVILSLQASLSYAFGVLLSCLYLQLLYHHTDNVSKESVPEIFLQKKIKKIGIRSEDIKNVFEKTIGGIAISLSSPRLVIPAAIYGLWVLSQHFANDYFDFQFSSVDAQLVPGMFGFLAYKAAALVQVYRDNEDLLLIFPDDDTNSS
ncbi:uncharacterized protein LOC122015715 isoform X1 [Zingiber officinale]|uniref:uncharacterized protein LOC122015715 isoform X1 n=1 Tax=Zingiber officinale TaxID=94328 RepID=UPI001C4CA4C6|nr:uncharacterized protein LOC122015715 isoform X1 [Zingiber officinale]XP_042428668.1 uncharacterized protein LOC122015715 isoform X1 [Zingiber officinale]